MNLGTYSNYWSIIESFIVLPTLLLSLYIYFKDPIKRWTFFGYLPVALIVLFDHKSNKLLILRNKGTWGLPQGGIFTSDATSVVEQTLRRELGIRSFNVEIRYSKAFRTLEIDDKYRTKRISLGTITPFTRSKGKGYVAYYVSTDLKCIEKKVSPGHGISDVTISSLKEARKIFKNQKVYIRKNELILDVLDELDNYLNLKKKYFQTQKDESSSLD